MTTKTGPHQDIHALLSAAGLLRMNDTVRDVTWFERRQPAFLCRLSFGAPVFGKYFGRDGSCSRQECLAHHEGWCFERGIPEAASLRSRLLIERSDTRCLLADDLARQLSVLHGEQASVHSAAPPLPEIEGLRPDGSLTPRGYAGLPGFDPGPLVEAYQHTRDARLLLRTAIAGSSRLHGDLHDGNILSDGRAVYLVDAMPDIAGHPVYDLGLLMGGLLSAWLIQSPRVETARVDQLADELLPHWEKRGQFLRRVLAGYTRQADRVTHKDLTMMAGFTLIQRVRTGLERLGHISPRLHLHLALGQQLMLAPSHGSLFLTGPI